MSGWRSVGVYAWIAAVFLAATWGCSSSNAGPGDSADGVAADLPGRGDTTSPDVTPDVGGPGDAAGDTFDGTGDGLPSDVPGDVPADAPPPDLPGDLPMGDLPHGDAAGPDGSLPDGSGDGAGDSGNPGDATAETGAGDVAPPPPPDFPLEELASPVPFRVGAASARIPVPIGIGTSGYMPAPGTTSPFVGYFTATTWEWMPLEAKVIALEGGTRRLLLVHIEMVGVSTEVRHAMADVLRQRTGVDWSDAIIIGATHTHAGPGRLSSHPTYSLAQDIFWPQFFDRITAFLADLSIQAMASWQPGRFGYTVLDNNDLGNDRRCETPEMMTGRMPLLRFDDAAGNVLAVALSYPMHGTVFGADDHVLSGDAPGGIKYKLQEQFDRYVPVLVFNSWGGDVSPADWSSAGADPEGIRGGQSRCEALGNRAAGIVIPALEQIVTRADVTVDSLSADVEFSIQAMGYDPDEWPYANGALFCGGSVDSVCFGEGDPPNPQDLIDGCGRVESSRAITFSSIGVARIGDLALAAFPGEPCTQIGLNVLAGLATASGQSDGMFIGYAQDYCGYSETYENWWLGGYETNGAVWGPLQGDYLTSEVAALAQRLFHPEEPAGGHPVPRPDFPLPAHVGQDHQTEPSTEVATVVTDVPATVDRGRAVTFTFTGGDPWLGAPLVIVEQLDGDTWRPFLRRNGTPLGNDAYEIETRLDTEPAFGRNPRYTPRQFRWTVVLPTARREPSTTPPPTGTLRFRAVGLARVGEVDEPFEVTSLPFAILDEPPRPEGAPAAVPLSRPATQAANAR